VGLKDRIERMPVLGTAWTMQQRYRLDGADQFAGAIALFGFISLVPLLILSAAVAGFVWTDPADQARVALAMTEAVPGLQAALEATGEGPEAFIQGIVDNRAALAGIGAVTLLLAGLKVINSAMVATTMVLRAPLPSGARGKLRQVIALPVLGSLALAGAAASSVVGWLELPRWLATPTAFVVTFPLDLLLFLAAYRMFSPTSELRLGRLLPGATLGAVGWAALKIAGAAYVANQAEDANALYGAFGGIIALLLLLYLAGRLYLYGAELTAVFAERERGLMISPETHGVPLVDQKDLQGVPTSAEAEGRVAAHDLSSGPATAGAVRSDGRPLPQDVAAGRASYAATSTRTALHPDAPSSLPPRGSVGTAAGPARPAGSAGSAAVPAGAISGAPRVAGRPPIPAWQLRRGAGGGRDARGDERDLRAVAAYGFAAAAVTAAWKLARDGRG
jgi:YihY family inner membrane protein